MATLVKKIRTKEGESQIDYTALANLPTSDETLSKSGEFADSKAVGDKIKSEVTTIKTQISEVKTKAESAESAAGQVASYKINGKLLSSNPTLSAADVGALPSAGGKMTGNIDMNGKLISNLGTPTADTHAATKNYVDSTFMPKSGGTFTGNISVPDPTANAHAAHKQYVDSKISSKTGTATPSLVASGWGSNKAQTVTATGVTSGNTVMVSPDPNSFEVWGKCGVRCTSQSAGKLTFTCNKIPEVDLTANVVILN